MEYITNGSINNFLRNNCNSLNLYNKLSIINDIANGLKEIHDKGLIHKDLHSGNILYSSSTCYITDLGLCKPANEQTKGEKIYGVVPYVASEVLRGNPSTKAMDVYAFGIIMNELMSEEFPYNNIPHDEILMRRICQGLRPKISEDTPKLLTDLIMKCWDANPEIRPTVRELYQILKKWHDECYNSDSIIYSQIKECKKIKEELKNRPKNTQIHPQAIYTSRLLNFESKTLPGNIKYDSIYFTNNFIY